MDVTADDVRDAVSVEDDTARTTSLLAKLARHLAMWTTSNSPSVPVPEDAPPAVRLAAFLGRTA